MDVRHMAQPPDLVADRRSRPTAPASFPWSAVSGPAIQLDSLFGHGAIEAGSVLGHPRKFLPRVHEDVNSDPTVGESIHKSTFEERPVDLGEENEYVGVAARHCVSPGE